MNQAEAETLASTLNAINIIPQCPGCGNPNLNGKYVGPGCIDDIDRSKLKATAVEHLLYWTVEIR